MCGIAGYVLKNPSPIARENIRLLLRSIRQRGPDDEGICLISRQGGARRLYKTDLTRPMVGSDLSHINNQQSVGGDEVLAGYEYQYWPKALMDLRASGLFWHAERYEFARKFMALQRSAKLC